MKTAVLLTNATRSVVGHHHHLFASNARLSTLSSLAAIARALSTSKPTLTHTHTHSHTETHTHTHAFRLSLTDDKGEDESNNDENAPLSVGRLPVHGPSEEEKKKYKTDSQTLARWLDVSVVKRKGRAFDADTRTLAAAAAMVFPSLTVSSLEGESVSLPQAVPAQAKLVVFSFKHYGFSLVRSWLDPWLAKYQPGNAAGVAAVEICFVEFGFMSMAKSLFAASIKNQISQQQHSSTFLAFGGILDFAANLLLPNVYTGYAFLLDKDNRIRWQGCGEAREDELQTLFRCVETLLNENKAAKKHK